MSETVDALNANAPDKNEDVLTIYRHILGLMGAETTLIDFASVSALGDRSLQKPAELKEYIEKLSEKRIDIHDRGLQILLELQTFSGVPLSLDESRVVQRINADKSDYRDLINKQNVDMTVLRHQLNNTKDKLSDSQKNVRTLLDLLNTTQDESEDASTGDSTYNSVDKSTDNRNDPYDVTVPDVDGTDKGAINMDETGGSSNSDAATQNPSDTDEKPSSAVTETNNSDDANNTKTTTSAFNQDSADTDLIKKSRTHIDETTNGLQAAVKVDRKKIAEFLKSSEDNMNLEDVPVKIDGDPSQAASATAGASHETKNTDTKSSAVGGSNNDNSNNDGSDSSNVDNSTRETNPDDDPFSENHSDNNTENSTASEFDDEMPDLDDQYDDDDDGDYNDDPERQGF